MVQRHAEAHLRPPLDRRGQQIGKCLEQDPLAPAAAEFHADGMRAANSTTR